MGSEANKVNDGTSFQPSEPLLCANGCGFFGAAATMNLCSRCFRDLCFKEEQASSAKAAMDKLVSQNQDEAGVDALSVKSSMRVSSSSPSAAASEYSTALGGSADTVAAVEKKVLNKCLSCKKKVGVMGFKCRCGSTFCGTHRYPEKHGCTFDFKAMGQEAIAKANPIVKADKVERF